MRNASKTLTFCILLGFLTISQTFAQDRSHSLLPGGLTNREDARNLLLERLGRAKDFTNLKRLAKKLIQNADELKLKDLLDKHANRGGGLNIDPNDPEWRETFKELAKDKDLIKKIEQQKIATPDEVKAFKKFTNDIKDAQPIDPMPNVDPKDNPTPDPKQPDPVDPAKKDNPDPQPVPPPTPTQPIPQNGETSKPWWERRLDDLKGIGGDLGDSLKEWGESIDMNWVKDVLPDLSNLDIGGWFEGIGDALPSFDFGGGGIDGPDLDLGGVSPEVSSETAGGIGSAVLIVVLVVLGIIIASAVVVGSRAYLQAKRNRAWQLGSWPVHPSAIRTQQDLIYAFEHLALLQLGRDASVVHHREIAAQLSERYGGMMEQTRAADHLANLYEQARYAPPQEPLSQQDVLKARDDLILLAGVAA